MDEFEHGARQRHWFQEIVEFQYVRLQQFILEQWIFPHRKGVPNRKMRPVASVVDAFHSAKISRLAPMAKRRQR